MPENFTLHCHLVLRRHHKQVGLDHVVFIELNIQWSSKEKPQTPTNQVDREYPGKVS